MTDTKCNDLPVITPRMVDGVGCCHPKCPCYVADIGNDNFDNSCGWPFVCDDDVCPVFATRTAARLEAVEAWAGIAEGVLGEPSGILGTNFLPLHWRSRIDNLLSTYPGKDGQ